MIVIYITSAILCILLKIYYRGRSRGMGNDAEGEEGNTDDN